MIAGRTPAKPDAGKYGITWDNDLEIHHIDRNRDNNDISNLILLPDYLHHELHNCLQEALFLSEQESARDLVERMTRGILNYGNSYDLETFMHLSSVLSECKRWGLLKSVLYTYPDGSPIRHITKNTLKWLIG